MDEQSREALRAERAEHDAIDWSKPNAKNGYYDQGRLGSRVWLRERKRSKVEVAASNLTSDRVPHYKPLPKHNPFGGDLTDREWREVRARVSEIHRGRAADLLEEAYKYAKFGEGKDLDTARANASQASLEEYVAAARDAALIFHRLGEALKAERERREDNLAPIKEAEQRG